jgi:hypothetical protein
VHLGREGSVQINGLIAIDDEEEEKWIDGIRLPLRKLHNNLR